jgi:hypothetical protein
LHDFEALFLWDAWWLGKDHEEPRLMSLELWEKSCLEEDLVIVFLMFHGDLIAFVDVGVQDLEFDDSNHRMDT